jgi:putative ATP-binding cassette transporter
VLRWSRSVPHQQHSILLIILSGIIGGVGGAGLIATINSALAGHLSLPVASILGGLCIVLPLQAWASSIMLTRFTERLGCDLRMQICRSILSAPYFTLEQLGPSQLLTALTSDVQAITDAVAGFPYVITQLVIVLGCLLYLGYLSHPLLAILIAYIVVGTSLHRIPFRYAVRHWYLHRDTWEIAHKSMKALVEGTKELKLNRHRRSLFLSPYLQRCLEHLADQSVRASGFASLAGNGGQILFYIFVGLVLFAGPSLLSLDRHLLVSCVVVVLYMMAPLSFLLNWMPHLGRALAADDKLGKLGLSLANAAVEPEAAHAAPSAPWQSLKFIDVSHSYRNASGQEIFCLGPLTLSFTPGEIVFVIGGNGSGKTTLAKLLVGLYLPDNGAMYLDRERVTLKTQDAYRQHFSAVFSDVFLFEDTLGVETKHDPLTVRQYMSQLKLDGHVTIRDGRFSTLDLSHGQRKRVALLIAYLEDRPIYLFDEWASDQDPAFKKVFYYSILPDLKARGKTVIVISHDDRYYNVADRIIKIEHGLLEYDRTAKEISDTTTVMSNAVS